MSSYFRPPFIDYGIFIGILSFTESGREGTCHHSREFGTNSKLAALATGCTVYCIGLLTALQRSRDHGHRDDRTAFNTARSPDFRCHCWRSIPLSMYVRLRQALPGGGQVSRRASTSVDRTPVDGGPATKAGTSLRGRGHTARRQVGGCAPVWSFLRRSS